MIHQPSAGFQGQASDIDIHAREVMETKDRLNRILAKHTGQTMERVKQDSDRDNFMSAEAARAYGIVDSMLEKRGELPIKSHLIAANRAQFAPNGLFGLFRGTQITACAWLSFAESPPGAVLSVS